MSQSRLRFLFGDVVAWCAQGRQAFYVSDIYRVTRPSQNHLRKKHLVQSSAHVNCRTTPLYAPSRGFQRYAQVKAFPVEWCRPTIHHPLIIACELLLLRCQGRANCKALQFHPTRGLGSCCMCEHLHRASNNRPPTLCAPDITSPFRFTPLLFEGLKEVLQKFSLQVGVGLRLDVGYSWGLRVILKGM